MQYKSGLHGQRPASERKDVESDAAAMVQIRTCTKCGNPTPCPKHGWGHEEVLTIDPSQHQESWHDHVDDQQPPKAPDVLAPDVLAEVVDWEGQKRVGSGEQIIMAGDALARKLEQREQWYKDEAGLRRVETQRVAELEAQVAAQMKRIKAEEAKNELLCAAEDMRSEAEQRAEELNRWLIDLLEACERKSYPRGGWKPPPQYQDQQPPKAPDVLADWRDLPGFELSTDVAALVYEMKARGDALARELEAWKKSYCRQGDTLVAKADELEAEQQRAESEHKVAVSCAWAQGMAEQRAEVAERALEAVKTQRDFLYESLRGEGMSRGALDKCMAEIEAAARGKKE